MNVPQQQSGEGKDWTARNPGSCTRGMFVGDEMGVRLQSDELAMVLLLLLSMVWNLPEPVSSPKEGD